MKVLHICSNYFGSKVHMQLYEKLDRLGVRQTIFSYFDGEDKIGKNQFIGNNTDFIYSDILNPWMRKIYPYKESVVYDELVNRTDVGQYSCIYATTLFSDGGIAYRIKEKYGKPYIVAIRNTDMNYFMPHSIFWRFGRKILLDASKIIFISTSKQSEFVNHGMVKPILNKIEKKIYLQPNGIDPFWIKNQKVIGRDNNYSICYVGAFTSEKNVIGLIKTVESLKSKYPNIKLNIVGGGGDKEKQVKELAKKSNVVELLGFISDKEELQSVFLNNSLFAMPSHHETFGLVYLEAMSQGLPVIYTKNEAIDGMFSGVGEAVCSTSIESIANGIVKIFSNYKDYQIKGKVNFEDFSWDKIAIKYNYLFNSLCF